jgi:hypothetical protein
MNPKQILKLEALEKKDILSWTDADWLIRETYNDEQTSLQLQKELKGKTVYTILRSVSASGMMRTIDMFYVKDGQPITIHYRTGKVFTTKRDGKKEGYRVSGCGMDMGFDLVSGLASHLFGDYKLINQQWI